MRQAHPLHRVKDTRKCSGCSARLHTRRGQGVLLRSASSGQLRLLPTSNPAQRAGMARFRARNFLFRVPVFRTKGALRQRVIREALTLWI